MHMKKLGKLAKGTGSVKRASAGSLGKISGASEAAGLSKPATGYSMKTMKKSKRVKPY